jgi:hypothetical protein
LVESLAGQRSPWKGFSQIPPRLISIMAKLKLTVACDSYDYLQPLRQGTVQRDPFPQPLKKNCHDPETMVQFANEQRLAPAPLTVEGLFTENTRSM